MCIGKFCKRNIVSATRDTTIVEAANLMRRGHVGDVIVVEPVAEGRRPVGIVTDRDIVVEIVAAGLDPNLVKVGDLLLRPLVMVDERSGYAETIRRMSAKGVRRMPVVDEAGLLVGIITQDDLLRQLAEPLAVLSGLAHHGLRQEVESRK